MVGTFNNWEEKAAYKLKKLKNGNWEINLPADAIQHGDLYKLNVYWDGGQGERIPAWATRVVQDEQTKIFSAQVWAPEKPYKFKKKTFKPTTNPLLIYECHIGMAQREEKVGTYNEFREKILPRIAQEGYNCIQIMAIQEHPYYGSFGYHVSSFFAASSRFGTPDELKALIDAAPVSYTHLDVYKRQNPRCLQGEEDDKHLTPFSINLKAKIRICNFIPQIYSLIQVSHFSHLIINRDLRVKQHFF